MNLRKRHVIAWTLLCLIARFAVFPPQEAHAESSRRPALVCVLVVDQLRGDFIRRFEPRFGSGGFRLLLERGRLYANAHYGHSATYTAVGHATIATGGYAAQHGMPGNSWFDAESGRLVYCVGDSDYEIVGAAAADGAGRGVSPRQMTSSTVGDELVTSSGGHARVFSVSIKDRGAILSGGRLGKAFWYRGGRFVSSSFYYKALPTWATAWNEEGHADVYRDQEWRLLRERDTYAFAGRDDQPWELDRGSLGRVFPHPLGSDDDDVFYSGLRSTPMGDELTVSFVETLIENEKLGAGNVTDMLFVSLSATDYIGHTFGPDSLEYEDNLLRLDRTVARLLASIDTHVGLERSLIVLSADHGIDSIPEYRQSLGFDAPRIDPDEYLPRAEANLKKRFGNAEPLIVGMRNISVYLNTAALARQKLDRDSVANAVARDLATFPGIATAMTRSELLRRGELGVAHLDRVRRSVHPERTGDVVLLQDPFAFLYYNVRKNACMHGSPYPYDTHVPILFCGERIRAGVEFRQVDPVDIAPTIAAYLGISAPSGSVGRPLVEALAPRGAK